MAFHLSSIKASPFMAPARTVRPTPHPAGRTTTQQVRRPETAAPSFRSATAAAASTTPATPILPDGAAAFRALFSGVSSNDPPAAPPAAPTAESVFGANPWLANPTGMGPDGGTYGYNQQYFATPQTAATVAQMLGGTVVEVNEITNAPGSTFQQQQPNEMVKLKDGAMINAGLLAGFYTHGYPQSMVDQMIANEVANTKA